MRKHQYSASVCAKSVCTIVPKLDYIMQYFMLFRMMYSKLGHKLTNVKTASINKVLIAFVHRITLGNHLYSPGVYLRICLLNCSGELSYFVLFFTLFPAMFSTLRHKLANVKVATINKVLITFFVYIKCQTTELQCANINIQQAFAQNLPPQLFRNSVIVCSILRSFYLCTAHWGTISPTSKRQGLIRR